MNNNPTICKACGAAMKGTVCTRCGWMNILHPAVIPQTMQDAEELQINTIRVRLQQEKKKDEELAKLHQQLEELQGANSKEQPNAKSASFEELEFARNKILDLTGELESVKHQFAELQASLAERQATSATDFSSSKLRGVVVIKNIRTENYNVLPVYPGVNTYGSSPDKGNHHQIRMRVRGMVFLSQHFEIVAERGRLRLRDLSDGTLSYNAMDLPLPGMYVEANNLINMGGILEIRIASVSDD